MNIKKYSEFYIGQNNKISNERINENSDLIERKNTTKNEKDKNNQENVDDKESENIITKNDELKEDELKDEDNDKSDYNNETAKNNQLNIKNDNARSNIEEREEKEVFFKMPTKEIKKNLTLRDKKKLILLARKLSPFDYSRIKRDLYCEDEEKGVKDALMLARQRLSQEDYANIREILSKFINLELIEKEV